MYHAEPILVCFQGAAMDLQVHGIINRSSFSFSKDGLGPFLPAPVALSGLIALDYCSGFQGSH